MQFSYAVRSWPQPSAKRIHQNSGNVEILHHSLRFGVLQCRQFFLIELFVQNTINVVMKKKKAILVLYVPSILLRMFHQFVCLDCIRDHVGSRLFNFWVVHHAVMLCGLIVAATARTVHDSRNHFHTLHHHNPEVAEAIQKHSS